MDDRIDESGVRSIDASSAGRMAVLAVLAESFELAQKSHVPVAVLLVAVDGYGSLVDELGAGACDLAVGWIRDAAVRAGCDPSRCYRVEWDEIAIVVPGATREQVDEIAEQIAVNCRDCERPQRFSDLAVRIEFGCSFSYEAESASEMLVMAEAAMLQLKVQRRRSLRPIAA